MPAAKSRANAYSSLFASSAGTPLSDAHENESRSSAGYRPLRKSTAFEMQAPYPFCATRDFLTSLKAYPVRRRFFCGRRFRSRQAIWKSRLRPFANTPSAAADRDTV